MRWSQSVSVAATWMQPRKPMCRPSSSGIFRTGGSCCVFCFCSLRSRGFSLPAASSVAGMCSSPETSTCSLSPAWRASSGAAAGRLSSTNASTFTGCSPAPGRSAAPCAFSSDDSWHASTCSGSPHPDSFRAISGRSKGIPATSPSSRTSSGSTARRPRGPDCPTGNVRRVPSPSAGWARSVAGPASTS